MKTPFLATLLLSVALPLSAMAAAPAAKATASTKSAKVTAAPPVKATASAKTVKVQPRQGKHRVARPVSAKKVR